MQAFQQALLLTSIIQLIWPILFILFILFVIWFIRTLGRIKVYTRDIRDILRRTEGDQGRSID